MWFSDERGLGIKHRRFFDVDGVLPLQCAALAVTAVSGSPFIGTVGLIERGDRLDTRLMNGGWEYAVGASTVSSLPTRTTPKYIMDTSALYVNGKITPLAVVKRHERGKKAF